MQIRAVLLAMLIALASATSDDSSTRSPVEDVTSPKGDPPPSSTTRSPDGTSTTILAPANGDSAVGRSEVSSINSPVVTSDQQDSVVSNIVRPAIVKNYADDSIEAGRNVNSVIIRRADAPDDTTVAGSVATPSAVPNPGVVVADSEEAGSAKSPSVYRPVVADSTEAGSITSSSVVRPAFANPGVVSQDSAVAGSIPSASVVRSPQGRSINSYGGWKNDPTMQYHIQTDEGPERYFKYQTISGQYRKEKRLEDGTVVGTYGWVDPNGYLRLRDYVADSAGYRVVKTKMVFVGKDEPIGNAVSKAKNVPSQGGTGYVAPTTYAPPTTVYTTPTTSVTPYPYSVPSNPLLYPSIANSPSNSLSGSYSQQQQYSTNPYINNPYFRPQQQQQQQQYNSNPYYTPASDRYDNYNNNNYNNNYNTYRQPQQPFPLYDGISATHNGFRYYLPRQYHEEERVSQDQTAGSFGYIDPFGIRRVVYYNTSPGSGFVHKKNNRYVGFNATPYDPRF